ncbi:MAG: STAS domain-containing protein [Gammaproteobacteria bacterium]|nr:STAS domain-containing protein [Gammaproteobacteria bacterium]
MEIELRQTGNISVAALQGEVDLSSSPQARSTILDCLNGGRPLLVDLSSVDYIDSSGIASLVEGFRLARDKQLTFGLLAVSEPALRVLQLARLDKVFPIYADLDAYQASR